MRLSSSSNVAAVAATAAAAGAAAAAAAPGAVAGAAVAGAAVALSLAFLASLPTHQLESPTAHPRCPYPLLPPFRPPPTQAHPVYNS